MPKRERSGDESSPARVVAPMKGERLHVHGVGARRRPLPDHDVELVVFQRGVKDFLKRRLQAVDFVDEQHLLVAKIGQDGGEVALDLQRRPGSLLERHRQFVGDDGGQRGLAQARRAVEQNVIERFAARLRGLDGDRQIFFYLGLSDELRQALRAQLQLERRIVLDRRGRNQRALSDQECFWR